MCLTRLLFFFTTHLICLSSIFSLLCFPQTFLPRHQYPVLWLRLTKVVLKDRIAALGCVLEVTLTGVFAIRTRQQRLLPSHLLRLPPFRHLLLNLLEIALQSPQVVLSIVNAALTNARITVLAIRDHTSNPQSQWNLYSLGYLIRSQFVRHFRRETYTERPTLN